MSLRSIRATKCRASLLPDRRNARGQPRDAVARHLAGPLRVDRLSDADRAQIQFQVGHQQRCAVLAEGGACRKQQSLRHSIHDAIEVAELGDRLAGRIDHYDLVGLIGGDPDIVVGIETIPSAPLMLLVNTEAAPAVSVPPTLLTAICTSVSLPVLATNMMLRALLKAIPLAPNGGVPVVVNSGSCFQTVPAPPCGPVVQMMPWNESDT